MEVKNMTIGKEYKFRSQKECLVYIGNNFSGSGLWHQFEKVSQRGVVWAEVQDSDLHLMDITSKDDE